MNKVATILGIDQSRDAMIKRIAQPIIMEAIKKCASVSEMMRKIEAQSEDLTRIEVIYLASQVTRLTLLIKKEVR